MYSLRSGWERPYTQYQPTSVLLSLDLACKHKLTVIEPTILHRYGRTPTSIGSSKEVEAKRGSGRQPTWSPLGKVDDEGTPDVYRILIDGLQEERIIDEHVKEPMSMDWRAERALMPAMFHRLAKQPYWTPRVGEIVLFIRTIGTTQEICFDDACRQYRIYDSNQAAFIGYPRWEAGVVGQASEEELHLDELVHEKGRKVNITYSGFRVEAFPDPNSNEKPDSKQYKYVSLHHTRPFVFWQDHLGSVPEKLWHPTIKHALTIMSTVSLVEKYHFRGTWPVAELLCKGMYIGSEFIVLGDLVRLMPKEKNDPVEDVLKITSIKLIFSNLDKASDNDYDEGHPYNSAIHVIGTAYTTNPNRAGRDVMEIDALDGPFLKTVSGYERLYRMHGAKQSLRVPFKRILGRCFEAEAMMLWFPPANKVQYKVANLDIGAEGIRDARSYSSKTYLRVKEGRAWFWADTRVEALDLGSFNAQEVGRYDEDREPYRWRTCIKIMDGMAGFQESGFDEDAGCQAKELAGPSKPLLGYSTKNSLVRSALQAATESELGSSVQSNREDDLAATANRTYVMKRNFAQSIGNPSNPTISSDGKSVIIDISNEDCDEMPDSESTRQSAVEQSLNGLAENIGRLQAGDGISHSAPQTPKKQRVEVVID